jgi:hypothetical protein
MFIVKSYFKHELFTFFNKAHKNSDFIVSQKALDFVVWHLTLGCTIIFTCLQLNVVINNGVYIDRFICQMNVILHTHRLKLKLKL